MELYKIKGVRSMDKKELVLKVLMESPEPMRPGDIAEKAGISKEEVDKILKDLKKEGKIESPKRCYYSLKKN